jgi:alpha-amylase
MMHWSLPSSKSYCDYSNFEKILKDKGFYDDYNQFVRGGFWRNFMAKYPESNHLHKKMLRASRRAYKMLAKGEYIDKILDNIWMGQCNCPYWHGVFGGLYLPNLRSPIYKSLIQAENELDKLEKRTKIFSEVVDFNFDGKDEIIIETNKYNLYFYPGTGGALYELDYKPINFNLLDIVSRREEGYHKKLLQKDKEEQCEDKILMKEEGLESILFYDWYRHGSLIDHFFGDDTTLEKVYQCSYPEQGDFVNQPYKYHLNETLFENKSNFIPQISKEIKTLFNTNDNNRIALSLYRDGHIWLGNERYPINISKQILLDNDSEEIQFKYVLSNLGPKSKVSVWFGIEFNFGLLAGNAPDRYYVFPGFDLENGALNSKGVIKNCSTIELIDKWLGIKITISIDKPASVWRFPIETISMDVNYFEKVYQSSVVLPNWKIEMTDEFKIDLKQKIEYL